MISSLELHNFKIHKNTTLNLAGLTMITGINGMGKSSIIQSLLLLRESVLSGAYPRRLNLRGETFNIGSSSASLVNWNISDRPDILCISLKFDGENTPVKFTFRYPQEDKTYLETISDESCADIDALELKSLFNDDFQYLSAYRTGPQSTFVNIDEAIDHRQLSVKMGNGELAVPFLDRYGHEQIPIKELSAGGSDLSLSTQTDLWLSRISPNIHLNITRRSSDFELSYTYSQSNKGRVSVSPHNTGYGISYTMALIVAVLSAKPGSTIIIENPEAHIHPAAQSALMKLICLAAAAGVQVILETHSDHIIFGALVNMKRGDIKHDNVAILHFDYDYTNEKLSATPVEIGPDSRIKNAPPHFVEQMNLDLDVLFDE